jgi:LysM repeat protein
MFGTKLRIRHSRPSSGYENLRSATAKTISWNTELIEPSRHREHNERHHMSTATLSPRMTGPAMAHAAYAARPVRQVGELREAGQVHQDGRARPAGRARLRITRRGYAVLTFLVALPLVIAAFAITTSGGGAAATGVASNVSFSYVTVQSGDTLWQIAGEIAPSSDPRDVISDIVHLNQLSTSDVQPGQRLAIPSQYAH